MFNKDKTLPTCQGWRSLRNKRREDRISQHFLTHTWELLQIIFEPLGKETLFFYFRLLVLPLFYWLLIKQVFPITRFLCESSSSPAVAQLQLSLCPVSCRYLGGWFNGTEKPRFTHTCIQRFVVALRPGYMHDTAGVGAEHKVQQQSH